MRLRHGDKLLDLVAGQREKEKIRILGMVGNALFKNGADFYELRLRMFPERIYFLRKNRDSERAYTIYAKSFWQNDKRLFLNPVGTGYLPKGLKTHLELRFPLLGSQIFMDLFPKMKEESVALVS